MPAPLVEIGVLRDDREPVLGGVLPDGVLIDGLKADLADVDLADFAAFQVCFNGANRPLQPSCRI